MSNTYEAGKEALDRLITWYEDQGENRDRNEATTRLHLIDTLLIDVLGWPKETIEAEKPHGKEYVDYALGRPATILIVEAKREGAYFSVPVGVTALVQKLSSLAEESGDNALKNAAAQVSGYCARRGVGLALITNGTQFVAFIGARMDGVPPMQGSALVFPSLTSMRENFRTLWDNLSRAGIETRKLYLTLRQGEGPTVPEPLSANLPRYPGYRRRNEIQADLQVLAEVFLEDITKEPSLEQDFLESTYASNGALAQYMMISRKILTSRYSVLHETDAHIETEPANVVESAFTKHGINAKLRDDIVASGASRRPIILLGDVGVGKTMFIKRLIHVEAKEIFEQAIVLYVDFGVKSILMNRLGEFILEEVERQLLDSYGIDIRDRKFVEATYNAELNRFDRGIYGELKSVDSVGYTRERISHLAALVANREAHILASLKHLRGSQRKQIVVFLDNIDQREHEFQEQVFLIAESLSTEWPATVFVSLRPDTFYRSRREGTLAAYQPRAFTIAPPRVDVVLRKRLDFALRQLRDTGRLEIFTGVSVSSTSLSAYLSMLLHNFENNEKLLELIESLSAGNIRMALQFVSRFIGSGHVDTSKILGVYDREGRYFVPPHEFLRAIAYGDAEYFDPGSSPLTNLFGITKADGREHFLLPLIVAIADSIGDRAGHDGYVSTEDIFAHTQKAGFSPEQIASAVERGVTKGLLERAPRLSDGGGKEHLRVTSAGMYTVKVLAGMFTYLDAMVVDTPILDDSYRRLISEAHTLSDRLRRADIFRVYLDGKWVAVESALDTPPFNWRELSARVRQDVSNISQRHG